MLGLCYSIYHCKLNLGNFIYLFILMRGAYMNLDTPSPENLKYLLDQLGKKLGVANRMLLDEKDYDLNRYEDLKFLYDHVSKAGTLSPAEASAFIDELRAVRKS